MTPEAAVPAVPVPETVPVTAALTEPEMGWATPLAMPWTVTTPVAAVPAAPVPVTFWVAAAEPGVVTKAPLAS